MLRILYDDFDQKVKNIHDEMDLHHSYKIKSVYRFCLSTYRAFFDFSGTLLTIVEQNAEFWQMDGHFIEDGKFNKKCFFRLFPVEFFSNHK